MNDLEHRIQCGIVRHLRLRGACVFAVPNGGARDAITGKRLKCEGVLAGVPDLVIVGKGEVFFVEIKTPTGKQSDSQKEFQREVEARGFKYLLWRSVDDAANWANETYGRGCLACSKPKQLMLSAPALFQGARK